MRQIALRPPASRSTLITQGSTAGVEPYGTDPMLLKKKLYADFAASSSEISVPEVSTVAAARVCEQQAAC